MSRYLLVFVLVMILVSCSSVQSSQLPTATPVPTSTLTPIPTATQTATSTPEAWVAIAEEYGMPQEQAQKLEGLDVSFERINKYVDGVLVTDKETGVDAFFYSEKYDFLVACDGFEGIEEMTDSTARSIEMSAWLYYKALDYDFNLEGFRDSLEKMLVGKVADGSMTAERAAEMKNFPLSYLNSGGVPAVVFSSEYGLPFEKDMGIFIDIDVPDNGLFTEHVFIPIAFLDLETGKIVIVKGFIMGGENNIDKLISTWTDMSVPAIVTGSSEDIDYLSSITKKTEQIVGPENMKDKFRTLSQSSDISLLDNPEIVVDLITSKRLTSP